MPRRPRGCTDGVDQCGGSGGTRAAGLSACAHPARGSRDLGGKAIQGMGCTDPPCRRSRGGGLTNQSEPGMSDSSTSSVSSSADTKAATSADQPADADEGQPDAFVLQQG